MPIYQVRCTSCETSEEVICSYSSLCDRVCKVCGCPVAQVPGKTMFQIEGYSMRNGYSNDEFRSLDGKDASWD